MKFQQKLGLALTLVVSAVGPAFVQEADSKKAKVVVSLFSGGGDDDVKELRSVLSKIPSIKVKPEAIAVSDIRREDKVFTKFLPLEMTDTSKTDIGAIAKAVASAATPSKDRVPPGLYLVIGYEAGGASNEQLRSTLENVKGVEAKHSFVGDINLWVSVDASGQAKIGEITKALTDVGIPLKSQP